MSCKYSSFFVLAAAFLLGLCALAPAGEPRLDGLFDEWTLSDRVATDPAGDASGAFDLRNVYAMSRGTRLFLRFDTGAVRNLPAGLGSDGTLLVQIDMPANRHLTIDLRNKRLWRDNNSTLTVSWSTLGFSALPTYASSDFELAVDLAFFGVTLGNQITINFSSSDSLPAAVPFTMSAPALTPARRNAARPPDSTIRIASQNTLQSGTLNSTQAPKLSRLIDAVNADIYCFQEEYNSSAAQIDSFVTAADPLENAANWSVHKVFDNAIATRGALFPITEAATGYAAAVVDLGAGNAIALFAVHPKCCGFIGSTEDATRITQMNGIAQNIASLRSASLGPALAPFANAPVIIIGDWNIVGSRAQLDIVETPAAPDLVQLLPVSLIGDEVITWRGTSTGAGSFWPGRLDLITHSRSGITPLNAFILETTLLNATELTALGLQAPDSSASDHLTLVADFTLAAPPPPPPPHCPGDANADSVVNFADITAVLSNWSATGPAGDANADNAVNFADITAVLSNWSAGCP